MDLLTKCVIQKQGMQVVILRGAIRLRVTRHFSHTITMATSGFHFLSGLGCPAVCPAAARPPAPTSSCPPHSAQTRASASASASPNSIHLRHDTLPTIQQHPAECLTPGSSATKPSASLHAGGAAFNTPFNYFLTVKNTDQCKIKFWKSQGLPQKVITCDLQIPSERQGPEM